MQESCMWFDILISVAGGIAGGAFIHAALARKVYNLQMDLASVQAQFLRERNQRASLTRSKDKESLELFNTLKNETPKLPPVNPLAKFGVR